MKEREIAVFKNTLPCVNVAANCSILGGSRAAYTSLYHARTEEELVDVNVIFVFSRKRVWAVR